MHCWLVGGSLRDDALGKKSDDFDLVFDFDPTDLARSLASRLKGTFVPLDPSRDQSRVVFSSVNNRYTLDFTPLRAPTLEEDLALRDYTCNALACDLKSPGLIIDPLGGTRDLLGGVLRSCSEYVLRDDPLRILKGVRHAVALNLVLHEDVCRQFSSYRHLLKGVAAERITSEMGLIFGHPQVHVGASILDHFEIIEHISPSFNCSIDLSGLHHVLSVEKRFEDSNLLSGYRLNIQENWPLYAFVRLSRSVVSRQTCETHETFTFLKQSRRFQAITKMLHALASMKVPTGLALDTRRKRALWLDQFQPSPPAAALFAASYHQFVSFDLVACLSDWLALESGGRIPDLISPRELVDRWGVKPDARLGQALKALRDDEISGRITPELSKHDLVQTYFKSH